MKSQTQYGLAFTVDFLKDPYIGIYSEVFQAHLKPENRKYSVGFILTLIDITRSAFDKTEWRSKHFVFVSNRNPNDLQWFFPSWNQNETSGIVLQREPNPFKSPPEELFRIQVMLASYKAKKMKSGLQYTGVWDKYE